MGRSGLSTVDEKGVGHIVGTVLSRKKFLFLWRDVLHYWLSCGRDLVHFEQ